MSIQINLRNTLPHMMEVGFPPEKTILSRPPEQMVTPISFPKTRIALWDAMPVGEAITLHLSYYRNPKLLVAEKTLRLAHRNAKQSNKNYFHCFLLGTVAVDDDEEGVTLMLDRFDPGRETAGSPVKVPTAMLPEDFIVPCTVVSQSPADEGVIVHSEEDFNIAFKMLQQHCCSRETLSPTRLLAMRSRLCWTENMDNINFSLHWRAVTVANTFDVTPVRPISIIPTALARNLSRPVNIAHVQGTCKYGFLTMDQTRQLLLILESDPKAYTLPLVGIWLSGITHINSPHVWALCLRYLYSASIQDRVLSENGNFLVVLYSLSHKDPEFYECHLCSGQQKLGFQLLTSTEYINLFKNVAPSDRPVQFELSAEDQNQETDFFKQVSTRLPPTWSRESSPRSKLSLTDHDSGVEDEDFSPRPSPSPHPVGPQFKLIHPSVPELSLVFDGSFQEARKATRTSPSFFPSSGVQQTIKNSNLPNLQELMQEGRRPSVGPPPIRRPLAPVNQTNQGKPGPTQNKPANRKGGPVVRKNSGSSASSVSSTSSSSTPQSSPSPNSSTHQVKVHLTSGKSCPPPSSRQGRPSVEKRASPARPSHRNVPHGLGSLPQTPSRPSGIHVPFPSPHGHPASMCNACPNHARAPCCPINSWQPPPNVVPPGPFCCQPDSVAHEGNLPASHPHLNFQPNFHCSPICNSNNHGGLPSHSIPSSFSPVHEALPTGTPKSHPCSGNPSSIHTTSPPVSPHLVADKTVPLTADAYRILLEQDKQLKELQAQIRKILEAQSNSEGSSAKGLSSLHSSPEIGMETQSVQKRNCVSIAVSTGASLFWNSPIEEEMQNTEILDAEVQNASDEMNIFSTAKATTEESMTTSLKAVDSPSVMECTHISDSQISTAHVWNGRSSQNAVHQSPVLRERGSMCLQPFPLEGARMALKEDGNGGCLIPREVKSEQNVYRELQGQVNNYLNVSSKREEETSCTPAPICHKLLDLPSEPQERRGSCTKKKPEVREGQNDKRKVMNAISKHLEELGVSVDLDMKNKKEGNAKVESASTLASINIDAVIPQLNYMSFANVGMSSCGSSAVDLSLEANAIALKYLSDSQLSQLSLSRGTPKNNDQQTIYSILQPKSEEKNSVGLSFMSPSNMSLATKKFMKRFGLIECGESSEDEEEDHSAKRSETVFPPAPSFNLSHGPALGRSPLNLQQEVESAGRISEGEGNILRNITNEIVPPETSKIEAQQLLKDLKPIMKLLAAKTCVATNSEKENGIQLFPEKLQVGSPEIHRRAGPGDSVENILDINRLKKLPKLF
ncbi:SCL-interrupting locus protein homolog [Polypterus senegalus]|uniref:SCL-interrupting locus protein homolog n=1 Tax=Polypterus senegalus TaxID=55291 RepID=UPI00196475E6|nr:SCL-interrupting locus protein homolog [Polypterus senegalus]